MNPFVGWLVLVIAAVTFGLLAPVHQATEEDARRIAGQPVHPVRRWMRLERRRVSWLVRRWWELRGQARGDLRRVTR